MTHEELMREAIKLSVEAVERGLGGPFGAVIARDGEIIARGFNEVTSRNDPTAHGEIVAIREACRVIGGYSLAGCLIYTSCEPCPMCLGAIHWARLDAIYYANNRHDAARIGFDDSKFYDELALDPAEREVPMREILRSEAERAFKLWEDIEDKLEY